MRRHRTRSLIRTRWASLKGLTRWGGSPGSRKRKPRVAVGSWQRNINQIQFMKLMNYWGNTVTQWKLPPYHCDLNPIELIWAQAKRKIKSSKNIKELALDAFNSITSED
ncbi:unnamed protein product [Colias eurytheme]|nr:unnamed protein product [Colias eurytheme]